VIRGGLRRTVAAGIRRPFTDELFQPGWSLWRSCQTGASATWSDDVSSVVAVVSREPLNLLGSSRDGSSQVQLPVWVDLNEFRVGTNCGRDEFAIGVPSIDAVHRTESAVGDVSRTHTDESFESGLCIVQMHDDIARRGRIRDRRAVGGQSAGPRTSNSCITSGVSERQM
jgi:hypothetical protein